jgi:tetratricopeptide (TPR) repeat protein
MENSRLQTLQEFIRANPNDSFVRYGLAQEYLKQGDAEKAVGEFRELLRQNPDYAAAYYHCGQALQKLDRAEEARAIYREGINVTGRLGNEHARSELQAALEMLG